MCGSKDKRIQNNVTQKFECVYSIILSDQYSSYLLLYLGDAGQMPETLEFSLECRRARDPNAASEILKI